MASKFGKFFLTRVQVSHMDAVLTWSPCVVDVCVRVLKRPKSENNTALHRSTQNLRQRPPEIRTDSAPASPPEL